LQSNSFDDHIAIVNGSGQVFLVSDAHVVVCVLLELQTNKNCFYV